jgi:mannitol/fructose-specific phosphotransferase system IIA component (Ntr-type)/galactitol-specific phosphotransferase system IIB component
VGTRTNGADVTPAVLDIVQDMVAKASLYLHPYLRLDQELTQNLATHLARVFDQLSLGMPIRNPLLEDIKKQYPHVFKAAKESGLVLGSALGRSVSEEEVGYITLYLVAALERLRPPSQARYNVLVVCSAGVATAHLLASRIRAEFPEVAIVDVISALELQRRRRLDDIDLIVCTIPVEVEYGDMRAVLVSPFLDNQDRAKLKRALEAQAHLSPGSGQADDQGSAKVSLSDVMTARTVSIGVRARNWQEVIDRTGRLLLSTGGIEARYIDAMKDVVTQYGPYMVAWPGIALLHARPEDGVRRVCLSLVTLGEPVSFGHPSNDPVDVAIALAAVDSHSHLPALLELHSILVNKEAIGMIRQAVFKSEILYVIAHAAQARGASQGS